MRYENSTNIPVLLWFLSVMQIFCYSCSQDNFSSHIVTVPDKPDSTSRIRCSVSKAKILYSITLDKRKLYRDYMKVLVDESGNIYAICGYWFGQGDMRVSKSDGFIYNSEKKTWERFDEKGLYGIIIHGKFKLYNSDFVDDKGKNTHTRLISFYNLTNDHKIYPVKSDTIRIKEKRKLFTYEQYRGVGELIPMDNNNERFYVLGAYGEFRKDPLSLLAILISGGHAGFAQRPYVGIISGNQIEYYKMPFWLADREILRLASYKVEKDKLYTLWIKHKEYGVSAREIPIYSCFDSKEKKWSPFVMPCNNYKLKFMTDYYCDTGNIAINNGKLFCTWYWYISHNSKVLKDSGVYISFLERGKWSKPLILYSSTRKCKPYVLVDKTGRLLVFWSNWKGLFFRCRTSNHWSKIFTICKGSKMTVRLFSVVQGQKGKIHIIYVSYSHHGDKLYRQIKHSILSFR